MRKHAVVLVSVAVATAACGGDKLGPQAPQVAGLTSVQFPQDTTSGVVSFTVTDADTAPDRLVVTVESSDPALLPAAGIVLAGTGSSRTLTLTPTPEATGTANVTVRVRDDGGLGTQATLAVTVQAVPRSFRGLTADAFVAEDDASPATLQGFTLQADADDDPAAFDSLLQ